MAENKQHKLRPKNLLKLFYEEQMSRFALGRMEKETTATPTAG